MRCILIKCILINKINYHEILTGTHVNNKSGSTCIKYKVPLLESFN